MITYHYSDQLKEGFTTDKTGSSTNISELLDDVYLKYYERNLTGVVLSYNVTIGKNVWIDTHALVGHDVVINDFTSIMPSSIISGRCEIGKKCILGAGSIIHQGTKIGDESLVGIGTTIMKDIPNKTSVIEFPRNIEKER